MVVLSLTINILSVVSGVTTLRLANLLEKHLVAYDFIWA